MASAAHWAYAQRVSGVVTDLKTKETLGSVFVKTAEKMVLSDAASGEYAIELSAGKHELEFSYLGYATKKVSIELAANQVLKLDVGIEEEPSILRTATVTSSKFEKPLGEVTVSMELLKPDFLKNTNSVDVSNALGKVPGVNMIDNQVDIRGGAGFAQGTGSRVLMLMDDMPILQADAGLPNFKDLPTENISQIEILKGAASALYGSAAMNGIINIRTAYPTDEPVTNLSIFNTFYDAPKDSTNKWWNSTNAPYERGVQIGHRQKIGKRLDLVAGYNIFDNSSYIRSGSITDSTPAYNKKMRTSLLLRYRISDNLSVSLNTNWNIGEENRFLFWRTAPDANGASLYETDANSVPIRGTNNRISIDPSITYYDKYTNKHKLQARYYYINNQNANQQSNFSHYIYGEYQYQRKLKNFYDLEVAAGLVGSNTQVTAEVYGNNTYGLSNLAAYAQLEKKLFDRLSLSLGLRYELNNMRAPDSVLYTPFSTDKAKAGDTTEAKPIIRFGANYQLTKATFVRASFGQAYRFPTILEKYVNTSATGVLRVFPNPQLTSETGWTAELGLKQGFKILNFQGFVDIAGFWTEYFNMTEFQACGFCFQVQNVGDTRIQGVDMNVAGTGKIKDVQIDLLTGYTYINPTYQNFDSLTRERSSDSVNVLKYRYRHTFKADIQAAFKGVAIGLGTQYFSFMQAIDAYLNDPFAYPTIYNFRKKHTGGTFLFNGRVSYTYKKAKLSFLVQNLLNAEFAIRPGILEAPRNFAVRADFTF
jgi:iron complex outermembrane receptor protein